jgi:hypothetical protein
MEQEVERIAHAAYRGDTETDDVSTTRMKAEQGIVGGDATKFAKRQPKASPNFLQLVGGEIVFITTLLRLVEDRQETIARFHLPMIYPLRACVKVVGYSQRFAISVSGFRDTPLA